MARLLLLERYVVVVFLFSGRYEEHHVVDLKKKKTCDNVEII